MSDIEMGKRRRFQFRLVTLLVWTTLLAMFLSLLQLFGLWLAFLLALYIFAVAGVRTEFGYKQGSVVAAVGTAIVIFTVTLLARPGFLIGVVAIAVGLLLGHACFLFVHCLALVGAWQVFEVDRSGVGPGDRGSDSEEP